MWIDRARVVALMGCVVLGILGCEREIQDLTVATVPAKGCVPLQVELTPKARRAFHQFTVTRRREKRRIRHGKHDRCGEEDRWDHPAGGETG